MAMKRLLFVSVFVFLALLPLDLAAQRVRHPAAVGWKTKHRPTHMRHNPDYDKCPLTDKYWLETFATVNVACSDLYDPSFGLSFGQVKRFGWFVSATSDFNIKGMTTRLECDEHGYVGDIYPFYDGKARGACYAVLAGPMLRIAGPVCLRIGGGYGRYDRVWRMNDHNFVRVPNESFSGWMASAGVQLNFRRYVASVEVQTLQFKAYDLKIGIGVILK